MRITFHGGAQEVTGSNYLIEVGQEKILVDCGLMQGSDFAEKENYKPFPYKAAEITAVLITHAHLDHTGRLPKLRHDGFKGKIYATHPTLDLARIVLDDSFGIMKSNARRSGRDLLYTEDDIINCWKSTKGKNYGQEFEITPNIKAVFRDAGHILGSAIIELYIKEGDKQRKIVFSGDLGNPPTPLLPPTDFIKDADYVLVESTYGDRIHEDREIRKEKLQRYIIETINDGGTLMIPSFAVERTQEILFEINDMVENKKIPPIPIFLDSPMAIKATAVYQKYPDYFNKEAMTLIKSGDDLFDFPGLKFTLSTQASKDINDVAPPKVIIAGSGMSAGGRILHHEKRYLPDPKSTLLVIGFQSYRTLGRRLLDGASEVKIFGDMVKVAAKTKAIGGYSAHADQTKLMEWVGAFKKKPKTIFVVQGEPKPAKTLADKINLDLGLNARVPEEDEVVELE